MKPSKESEGAREDGETLRLQERLAKISPAAAQVRLA